jgi:chemotaxis methyl-accepting protein methylase
MAMELRKKATLGELIEAVTNEVSRVTRGSANTNVLVSHIVRDLFTTRRVRLKRRRVLKIA